MKAVFTALVVSLVFALFFVLFLIVPLLVIAVGYFWMVSSHNRAAKKAKARQNQDDGGDGDGGGDPARLDDPNAPAGSAGTPEPAPGREIDTTKPPLVGSPAA